MPARARWALASGLAGTLVWIVGLAAIPFGLVGVAVGLVGVGLGIAAARGAHRGSPERRFGIAGATLGALPLVLTVYFVYALVTDGR
jgi:hypothetical protein